MTSLKLILVFLLISSYSISQPKVQHITNPEVVRLSNQIIPLVSFINNPDSCIKALSYLDSATSIDSSCFLCYYNKLMFLSSLKKFEDAIISINACIRINPNAADIYI
ncbi:hypothetical protein SAMN05444277_10439 [Parafilimonas terrae]|uniref:Tetratricopeptide repeat-containing protein n=1 Tax=Parafilimonas terrae TaxID=1465490 RepID=A0A1I5UTX8_9BACT|nr:hypothetical protein SAMN05444277_10439 [Parafilimonas terrae]